MRNKLARFGEGAPATPTPAPVPIDYKEFSGGYVSQFGRDGAPANASPAALDIEVTQSGYIRRMAGTTLLESMGAHEPSRMVVQRALGGSSELILFAAPYLGVRRSGATTWTDISLGMVDNYVVTASYGPHLIFYPGALGPWIRRSDGTVAKATQIPSANSYATFAARLFCAGAAIDGEYQPMGVQWSDTSGDPDSFDGG